MANSIERRKQIKLGRVEEPQRTEVAQGLNREIIRWGSWEVIGPTEIGEENFSNEGVRALGVTLGGWVVAGTETNGIYTNTQDGNWHKIPGAEDLLGTARQMTASGEDRIYVTADRGVGLVYKANGEIRVRMTESPIPEFFLQTGALIRESDGGQYLLAGGWDILTKVRGLESGEEVTWERLPTTVLAKDGVPILIRTLVTNPNNPDEIYVGGWQGFSGFEMDENNNIKPGAGVWRTRDQGRNWEQMMSGVNVNSLAWYQDKLIVGTEGAGEWKGRVPDVDFPSLYLLDQNGQSRPIILPNLAWDLVTPGKGIEVVRENIFVSFFGFSPMVMQIMDIQSGEAVGEYINTNIENRFAGHFEVFLEPNGIVRLYNGGFNFHTSENFTPVHKIEGKLANIGHRVSIPLARG